MTSKTHGIERDVDDLRREHTKQLATLASRADQNDDKVSQNKKIKRTKKKNTKKNNNKKRIFGPKKENKETY